MRELPPAPQEPLDSAPYDHWVAPGGDEVARFHRLAQGYLVRFPGQADFLIDNATMGVTARPAEAGMEGIVRSLFHNAIAPLIENHSGGLCLHGSAVSLAGRGEAIAFLGQSRRGKTTLAGAFAKAGHPFLSEDTVALDRSGPVPLVRPSRPVLRLFPDSVRHLLGSTGATDEADGKGEVAAGDALPFAATAAPLQAIYLLGPGTASRTVFHRLPQGAALAELMQHAFVLDVEDKPVLSGHFQRLSDLAERVACFTLDFPRRYAQLPSVINTVLDHAGNLRDNDAS